MDWMNIALIVITILLIGFFSGIEVVFSSANKLSIELRKKQGIYSGKIWSSLMEKPARFLCATLLIFTLLLTISALVWGHLLSTVWSYWNIENASLILIVETVGLAFIVIIIMTLFKAFFKAKDNVVTGAGFIAFIVTFGYSLFAGIAQFFVGIAEWMLKYLFNVKLQHKTEAFAKMDINYYTQHVNVNVADENSEMNNDLFENVLSLSETRIRECLIPRKEIKAVNIYSTVEDIKTRFIETKLTKLVVYEDNIDNVKGYVHQLAMFKNPADLASILLPIPVIPDSMKASDLMNKFTKERKSIAWVIDEYGGTAGIVTMEDLLEEIFGDIYDEFDVQEEFIDKQVAPKEFLFSGRLELDFLKHKYKLSFRKSEETETLSGYIINLHQSIPRQRDRIIIEDYQFDILKVTDTRIETVKLKVLR